MLHHHLLRLSGSGLVTADCCTWLALGRTQLAVLHRSRCVPCFNHAAIASASRFLVLFAESNWTRSVCKTGACIGLLLPWTVLPFIAWAARSVSAAKSVWVSAQARALACGQLPPMFATWHPAIDRTLWLPLVWAAGLTLFAACVSRACVWLSCRHRSATLDSDLEKRYRLILQIEAHDRAAHYRACLEGTEPWTFLHYSQPLPPTAPRLVVRRTLHRPEVLRDYAHVSTATLLRTRWSQRLRYRWLAALFFFSQDLAHQFCTWCPLIGQSIRTCFRHVWPWLLMHIALGWLQLQSPLRPPPLALVNTVFAGLQLRCSLGAAALYTALGSACFLVLLLRAWTLLWLDNDMRHALLRWDRFSVCCAAGPLLLCSCLQTVWRIVWLQGDRRDRDRPSQIVVTWIQIVGALVLPMYALTTVLVCRHATAQLRHH